MSRMGEWWSEHQEDNDLEFAAFAHEEELHQQQLEKLQQCPFQPGLIKPHSLQLLNSQPMSSSKLGQVTEMTPMGSWLPKKS